MGIFRNKDQYEGYNIYSMKKYVDKKRITYIVIAIVAIIITLSMSIYYLVDTTLRVKKSKEFEKQIIEYNQQQQEEAKQKDIKVINCYYVENISNIKDVLNNHDAVLNTAGEKGAKEYLMQISI